MLNFGFLFLFCAIFLCVKCQSEMSYIGLPIEAFTPCPDLGMEHLIGLPPDEENYWDGILFLDRFPNIPELRFKLTLDNEAVVTIDRKVGRVHNFEGNIYNFQIYKTPPKIDSVKFRVQAGENKPFPNVVSLELNNLEICPNATKWNPTIIGDADKAGTLDKSGENANRLVSSGNECGLTKIKHKQLIIDGNDSKAGDWPWHAAIYKYNLNKNAREYICGGTLISSSIVMTAAHCITESGRSVIPARLLVALGKYNLLGSDIGSQELTIFKVIVHPNFNHSTLANDIALLKFSAEVTFSSYIQPICLSSSDTENDDNRRDLVNQIGTVVGWGRWGFGTDENLATVLQQASMPVVSVTTCLASYPPFFSMFLTDKTFCAGTRNGSSVCNGDSGGGLYFSNKIGEELHWNIRGIVSLSVAKNNAAVCDPEHFVLFTDVSRYTEWIKHFMN